MCHPCATAMFIGLKQDFPQLEIEINGGFKTLGWEQGESPARCCRCRHDRPRCL